MVDLIARIRGQNDTKAAFDAVARDAQAAGQRVAAAGETAAVGLRAEAAAMATVARSSQMAAMQQKNLLFQLNDIGVSLAGGANPLLVIAQQGGQIATIWGPEEGGVGRAFKETGNMALGLVTKFWPVAAVIGVLTAGVGAMTTEINKNQKQQVGWGDVVAATWQLASENILSAFQPVIDTLAGFWDWVSPMIAQGMNNTIGVFVFGFTAIKDSWALLPSAIGDLAIQAANNVTGALNDMLNKNRAQTVAWLQNMGNALGPILGGSFLGASGVLAGSPQLDLKPIDNPFAGAAGKLGGQLGQDAADAFGKDYIGMIGERARQIASLSDETKKLGDAQSTAAKTSKLLKTGLDAVGGVADRVAEAQKNMAATALGAFAQLGGALSKLFGKNKAIATATAVLQGLQGVAYALGSGPPPWNFISAAAVGIEAAANIAAINSTSETSTSMPSVGGAGASAAASGGAAAQQAINIHLVGSARYSGDEVAQLMEQMATAMGDGAGSRLINVIKG